VRPPGSGGRRRVSSPTGEPREGRARHTCVYQRQGDVERARLRLAPQHGIASFERAPYARRRRCCSAPAARSAYAIGRRRANHPPWYVTRTGARAALARRAYSCARRQSRRRFCVAPQRRRARSSRREASSTRRARCHSSRPLRTPVGRRLGARPSRRPRKHGKGHGKWALGSCTARLRARTVTLSDALRNRSPPRNQWRRRGLAAGGAAWDETAACSAGGNSEGTSERAYCTWSGIIRV
jgi:hypothetical protein